MHDFSCAQCHACTCLIQLGGIQSGFLPGDNPVYELGNTEADVSSRPSQISSPVRYMKFSPNRDSMLERELENPIYGDDREADDKYTVLFEHQSQNSAPDNEFVNPVYSTEAVSNTYEVICDT